MKDCIIRATEVFIFDIDNTLVEHGAPVTENAVIYLTV